MSTLLFLMSNSFHHFLGFCFFLFQILLSLSFLILSPHLPDLRFVFFFPFLLILNILALFLMLVTNLFLNGFVFFPTLTCTESVKNLKLFIPPPHNPFAYTPQLAIPCGTESEAKLLGNPLRDCLNSTYFEWYRSTLLLNCYSQC